MIDSHAHLNDSAFIGDLDEVLARAQNAGVHSIINVGYDLKSSQYAVELAKKRVNLWATIGLHPHDAKTWTDATRISLLALAVEPEVLAIGEIGLDYHYDNSPREIQREVFRKQLGLAQELNLPVVIHSREAAQDTLEIMREFPEHRYLLHCYSGSFEMAELYREMDCYFSFGGPITFKNAHKLRNVVNQMSLERILIETDCPYLTPHPHRGRRNEPAHLVLVAEKLAEIKGLSLEEIVKTTEENTRKFFGLANKEDAR